MKIKIYSPVDAIIKPITECSDDLFAAKTLGDGVLIIPKKDNFKSPFEDAKVEMIFDTKHAIYFDTNGVKALMHVGLDTVKLNGTPFKIKIEQGSKVDLKTNIMSVDLKVIERENLSIETPIVFETDDTKKVEVKILKTDAKQGELIAEISLVPIEKKDSKDPYEIKSFKNKYRQVGEEIYANLGGSGNYENVYNCMTRFRTKVYDKSKIDLEKIKKIKLVKGAQWNGDELQIIIGGEVIKVVDEFKAYELNPSGLVLNQTKTHISLGRRILSTVVGIIGPILPILVGSAMFGAIYAILSQTGAVITSVMIGDELITIDIGTIQYFDIFSALMFVLSKAIINLIGVFFLYSTVRFFKGNTIFAIAVGILLVYRSFFPASYLGVPLADANFGDWVNTSGKQGFLLFAIGDYPIVIGGYEGSVLPFIAAGVIVIFSDKWIKTWMPSVVDIIFRPFLVVLIAIFGTWFVFGPIMGIIEYGLINLFTLIGKIPYGFGVALFAMLWQPLVLTGAHVPVVLPIIMQVVQGEGSMLSPGLNIAVFAQVGAVIGVALATKNAILRSISLGACVGGFFGVTEPIIYGVNLPKVRPFLIACLSAGVAGLVSGILELTAMQQGGQGIFAILSFTDFKTQGLALMTWIIAIGLSVGLTYFLYNERTNEITLFNKTIKKVISMIGFDKTSEELKSLKNEMNIYFANEIDEVKNFKLEFKRMEKYIALNTKYEQKLIALEDKETKQKEKMYKNLVSIKNKLLKDSSDISLNDKFVKLNAEYNEYNLDKEKDAVKNKINDNNSQNIQLNNELDKKREEFILTTTNKLNKLEEQNKISNVEMFKNNIWNAMHSVEIGFGIEDKKDAVFAKNNKFSFNTIKSIGKREKNEKNTK